MASPGTGLDWDGQLLLSKMAMNGRVRGNKKSTISMRKYTPELLEMVPTWEDLEDRSQDQWDQGMPHRKGENLAKKTDSCGHPGMGRGTFKDGHLGLSRAFLLNSWTVKILIFCLLSWNVCSHNILRRFLIRHICSLNVASVPTMTGRGIGGGGTMRAKGALSETNSTGTAG